MCHKILANIYSTSFLKDSKFRSKQKSKSLLSYCKLLVLHRLVLLLFLFYSTYINRLLPVYRCCVKLIRLNLTTSHHYITFLAPALHELSSWNQKLKKLFTWLSCYYFTFYKQLPQHIQHIFVSSINTHHFGLIN